MPKIVDHDQRRIELVQATWRIIARYGIDGATMREIAAEAGFANGALKPYFPTKDDLLAFAFGYVFDQTNRRVADSIRGHGGLDALRRYCMEVLPVTDVTISEARLVIPFWQKALNDPDKATLHADSMERWRVDFMRFLSEAREAGEVRTHASDDVLAGQLMSFLLGAQITASLTPEHHSPEQLTEHLDSWLRMLSADS
ncbi:TetR family transcriptional regulator C-terminal domain-containing protein [Arthrobacter sp.]|uniref:TetR/AcrR family transcriptional regulator n=1 Tax=Arthrobacter sp. TaxID=1667 RepID=UPI00339189F7